VGIEPTSKLTVKLDLARKRARVAELCLGGNTCREIEAILREDGFRNGIDHASVARDLARERARFNEMAQASTAEHRQRVLEKLTQMEDFVRARGGDDPNYIGDLLGILDRASKLMGLNLERNQVNVAVGIEQDPAKMVGYRKFVYETRWIPESAFDAIWALCRELSQPPTAETTAAIGPPADSPLWRDDEPLMLAQGDTEVKE
jgi:hypothetical protein